MEINLASLNDGQFLQTYFEWHLQASCLCANVRKHATSKEVALQ